MSALSKNGNFDKSVNFDLGVEMAVRGPVDILDQLPRLDLLLTF